MERSIVAVSSQEKGDRQQRRSLVRFGIILFSCFLAFAIAYFKFRRSDVLDPFLSFNAKIASFVWNLFGGSAEVDGVIISSGSDSFEVITECTSIIPTAILICAVLAWRSSAREKLIGIAAGTTVLFVINIVRIISLVYVGSAFPDYLDVAHFYVWQVLLILFTVGLWLFWAVKLVRTPPENP